MLWGLAHEWSLENFTALDVACLLIYLLDWEHAMKKFLVWIFIITCLVIGFEKLSAKTSANIRVIEAELNNIASR